MKRIIVTEKANCVGCRVCEIVCAASHYKMFNTKRSRIKVPASYPLPSPPVFCKQCPNAKCIEVCAADALTKAESGVILHNEQKCVKCEKCVTACPFEAMFIDITTKYPIKCDLCSGDPHCVKFCGRSALAIQE